MSENIKIDKIFKALADVKRREIFHVLMLATSAMSLSQIAKEFDISRQGITKHITIMEDAGLIKTKSEGRERFCEIDATPLNEIKDWLSVYDRFWDDKLKNLNDFLERKKS